MIKPIWALAGGVALLGMAGGVSVLVARSGGGVEDLVEERPPAVEATRSDQSAATPATPTATPRDESKWIPGAPIDTPPAEVGAVLNSPPSGEEGQWGAVAEWAQRACHIDGGRPDPQPAAMFKTTAGEIRRRLADVAPEGTALGSNWQNEDTFFLVVFRGVFPNRQPPPAPGGKTYPPIPPGNICVYTGNGRTDDWDNSSVGPYTTDKVPDSVDGFFR